MVYSNVGKSFKIVLVGQSSTNAILRETAVTESKDTGVFVAVRLELIINRQHCLFGRIMLKNRNADEY